MYDHKNTTKSSSTKILTAFKSWINTVHKYRHELGTEEPEELPEELLILLVSQGISYLRWLSDIDRLNTCDEL